MTDRLTRRDVERIAALAHLELTDDEAALFTQQLADILAYAARLQEVDMATAGDAWQPGGATCPRRADVIRPSLDREAYLATAPDGVAAPGPDDGAFFRVPRVLA